MLTNATGIGVVLPSAVDGALLKRPLGKVWTVPRHIIIIRSVSGYQKFLFILKVFVQAYHATCLWTKLIKVKPFDTISSCYLSCSRSHSLLPTHIHTHSTTLTLTRTFALSHILSQSPFILLQINFFDSQMRKTVIAKSSLKLRQVEKSKVSPIKQEVKNSYVSPFTNHKFRLCLNGWLSNEVTLALLALRPRVRITAIPRCFRYDAWSVDSITDLTELFLAVA